MEAVHPGAQHREDCALRGEVERKPGGYVLAEHLIYTAIGHRDRLRAGGMRVAFGKGFFYKLVRPLVIEHRNMPATKPDGDISAFVQSMLRRSTTDIRHKPFLGIDECLNRVEIEQLGITLMQRALIDTASPLWYETRSKDCEIVGTFLGGVSKDSALRGENPFIADIGAPVKYHSWSDFKVVQMLVVQFMNHDKVVLLSENTKNNEGGLRRLLKEVVGPALQARPEHLSLTALFKKGRTDISSYCNSVFSYFEAVNNDRGYVEFLL